MWQLARALSQEIYPLTFVDPIAKDFRFKDQLRGTCGSIMDNIAEGFERGSKLEFINSLTIAKGEAGELNHSYTVVWITSISLLHYLKSNMLL